MSTNEIVTYNLDQELISLTMTTLSRLLKLGNDPTLLYLFLVRTAKLQNNSSVYATNKFISDKKGLGWNRHKVSQVKQLLEEEGFIEPVVRKDEKSGQIVGHYIKVHYISTRSENHTVDEPHGGSSNTNTIDKKINTIDEKPNLFPKGNKVPSDDETKPFLSDEIAEIYHLGEDLNRFWKYTIGKGSHKSLESKLLVSGKYGGAERKTVPVWAPVTSAIRNIGLKRLKIAINNYKKAVDVQDKYSLQTVYSLGEFCYNTNYEPYLEGVPEKKFASKDPWDAIRADFQPLTSICSQVFDEKTKRYYGFQLNKINSDIRWEDIVSMMTARNDQWGFDDFMELEWMIAGMLWRRRKQDFNLIDCQNYMIKWKELIPQFKKQARKWLKEDWELYG